MWENCRPLCQPTFRFRTLEHEYDGVKCHCDDEIQQREEVQRQVAKAAAECDGWRKKFEQDALVRIEELESTKVSRVVRDGTLIQTSCTHRSMFLANGYAYQFGESPFQVKLQSRLAEAESTMTNQEWHAE